MTHGCLEIDKGTSQKQFGVIGSERVNCKFKRMIRCYSSEK